MARLGRTRLLAPHVPKGYERGSAGVLKDKTKKKLTPMRAVLLFWHGTLRQRFML